MTGWDFWLPVAIACFDVMLTFVTGFFAYTVWSSVVHVGRKIHPHKQDKTWEE